MLVCPGRRPVSTYIQDQISECLLNRSQQRAFAKLYFGSYLLHNECHDILAGDRRFWIGPMDTSVLEEGHVRERIHRPRQLCHNPYCNDRLSTSRHRSFGYHERPQQLHHLDGRLQHCISRSTNIDGEYAYCSSCCIAVYLSMRMEVYNVAYQKVMN